MWKSAYVGVYQLLNWKMHGQTFKLQDRKLVYVTTPQYYISAYFAHLGNVFLKYTVYIY